VVVSYENQTIAQAN